MGARFTALAKPDGGVRGIATGSSLRRLVARILARQCPRRRRGPRCQHPSRPRGLLVETILARSHLRTPQESQEWQHGWQFWASSISDFRKTSCQSVPPRLELTFSHTQVSTHSLPWLSLGFRSFPRTCSGYCLRGSNSRPVDEAVCSGCHAPLDPLGCHRAACALADSRSGRL